MAKQKLKGEIEMKILKIAAILGIVTAGAFASGENLKSNMQKLNEHMTKVEKAFNTGDLNGAVEMAKELDSFNKSLFDNSDKVKAMLPAGKEKYSNIAMSYSQKLDKALVAMGENIQAKKYDRAQKEFMNAQKACMNCHALVRDWGK